MVEPGVVRSVCGGGGGGEGGWCNVVVRSVCVGGGKW